MNRSAAIELLVGTSILASFGRVLVLRGAVRVPCATAAMVSPPQTPSSVVSYSRVAEGRLLQHFRA
jgi:hypothetical protein